jgi:hypothetical protein
MMLMLIHLPLEDDFLKKQEIIIQLYSVNVTANEYLIGVDFSANCEQHSNMFTKHGSHWFGLILTFSNNLFPKCVILD